MEEKIVKKCRKKSYPDKMKKKFSKIADICMNSNFILPLESGPHLSEFLK